jgi:hypothetical protein
VSTTEEITVSNHGQTNRLARIYMTVTRQLARIYEYLTLAVSRVELPSLLDPVSWSIVMQRFTVSFNTFFHLHSKKGPQNLSNFYLLHTNLSRLVASVEPPSCGASASVTLVE